MELVEITASEFKSKCLQLMDEVATGEKELVITKHGKPVSKLVRYHKKPKSLFGIAKDDIEILGDIVSPIEDLEWGGESVDQVEKP